MWSSNLQTNTEAYCDLNFMNQVLEMYYTHFPIYNPYLDQVDLEF